MYRKARYGLSRSLSSEQEGSKNPGKTYAAIVKR
jgi:hypothetical protein